MNAVNESLAAACGQFEQTILSSMLASAGVSRSRSTQDADDDDEGAFAAPAESADAFAQLVAQALASAVERAGGLGLRAHLLAALKTERAS